MHFNYGIVAYVLDSLSRLRPYERGDQNCLILNASV